MKFRFKKIISVMLCLVLLTVYFGFSSSAVRFNEGLTALRSQWSRGNGPKKDGYDIDYSFYSPKKGENDETKYPLVVFMAGAFEGSSAGKELTANDFAYWSSEEYQAKFKDAGGAYLLIARAPEEAGLFWDSPFVTEALFAAISDFADKNSNVDKDRISVLGWCLGACGASMLVTKHPDFFSAGVYMSSRYTVSNEEAEKIKNIPTWIIACVNDSYSVYNLYSEPFWNKMVAKTNDRSNLRLTTCTSAPNTSVLYNHKVWDMVALDMTGNGGCSGIKTVDGNSKTVDSPSVISWLSEQRKSTNNAESPTIPDDKPTEPKCSCQCHASGISSFIWMLKSFIYRIFGMNEYKTCACGKAHW